MKKFVFAVLTFLMAGTSAYASPALHSFNAENGGSAQLNYSGFADFNVTKGSVDLIGNGSFDAYAGNGLYVDMAGTTGQYGALTTKTIFGPGSYKIDLSLGGSIYSGIADGIDITAGGGSLFSATLPGLTTSDYSFIVNLASAQAFTITDLGLSGNPNIGATLFGFNVSPVRGRTAVPEPLTLSLFGAGLAGAAALRRRKAKA